MIRKFLAISVIFTLSYTLFIHLSNDLHAQNTTFPPTEWIAPTGSLTFTGGNPIYQWAEVEGVSSYKIYVGPDNPTYTPGKYFGTVPATVCDDGLCSADLTTQKNDLRGTNPWLTDGDYAAWVNTNPDNDATWQGPFRFSVDVPLATAPNLQGLTTTDTFVWQLDGNATYASWFRIYYARQGALGAPLLDTWVQRETACGGMTATTCQYDLATTSGTRYAVYMQSWGPGGFSTGGNVPGADGWSECRFTVSGRICAPQPTAPSEFIASVVGFVPTLSWKSSEHAAEYSIWVGVWEGNFVKQVYFTEVPVSAAALNCEARCTLTLPEIPADQYRWYVQASGVGGVPENNLDGWVEGPRFRVTYAGARDIYLAGKSLGSNRAIFTTVGDSITDTPVFLRQFAHSYNLYDRTELIPVIKHFMQIGGTHSFANLSVASRGGWRTTDVLNTNFGGAGCFAGESPLVCEYRRTKPSLALIMLGTNNLPTFNANSYKSDLIAIVDISAEQGVIPVLSTIPTRRNYEAEVQQVNNVIRTIARERELPLWDFYVQLEPLPDRGMLWDGIHLSLPENSPFSTTDFTPENLRFGGPMRNLRALEILDHIWRDVMFD